MVTALSHSLAKKEGILASLPTADFPLRITLNFFTSLKYNKRSEVKKSKYLTKILLRYKQKYFMKKLLHKKITSLQVNTGFFLLK